MTLIETKLNEITFLRRNLIQNFMLTDLRIKILLANFKNIKIISGNKQFSINEIIAFFCCNTD